MKITRKPPRTFLEVLASLTGFEPAALRVGVIRPLNGKARKRWVLSRAHKIATHYPISGNPRNSWVPGDFLFF
jgi:hypothetical protein